MTGAGWIFLIAVALAGAGFYLVSRSEKLPEHGGGREYLVASLLAFVLAVVMGSAGLISWLW